jgi:hypothetical protein
MFLYMEGTGVTFDELLAASSDEIKRLPPRPTREGHEGALKARAIVQDAARSGSDARPRPGRRLRRGQPLALLPGL